MSGGIDSSIIAYFVNQAFPSSALLSLQSEVSVDDDFVEILARYLQKNPFLVKVTVDDLRAIEQDVIILLKKAEVSVNQMQFSLGAIYYLLFRAASLAGIKTIFTGQGPDILLAGYNKYKNLSGIALKAQITRDLVLLETDKKRDGMMAKRWDIQLVNPYLSPEFTDFALSVPADLLIHGGMEKYLSRVVGNYLGLPKQITERPKKAMQYSTGVQKIYSKN